MSILSDEQLEELVVCRFHMMMYDACEAIGTVDAAFLVFAGGADWLTNVRKSTRMVASVTSVVTGMLVWGLRLHLNTTRISVYNSGGDYQSIVRH